MSLQQTYWHTHDGHTHAHVTRPRSARYRGAGGVMPSSDGGGVTTETRDDRLAIQGLAAKSASWNAIPVMVASPCLLLPSELPQAHGAGQPMRPASIDPFSRRPSAFAPRGPPPASRSLVLS